MNVTMHAVIRTIFFVFSLRFFSSRLATISRRINAANVAKNSGLNVRIIQNDSCVIRYASGSKDYLYRIPISAKNVNPCVKKQRTIGQKNAASRMTCDIVAAELGFEPRQYESES